MVFSSVTFIFAFLPVTLIVYSLLRSRARNWWLLAVSLFFYAWGGLSFLPVMLVSILINYAGGMGLIRFRPGTRSGKAWLSFIIALNLALLGYWKYFNFGVSIAESITGRNFGLPQVALPIGISFFTFQGISYVVDAYRGDASVQKNPLIIALYISMFPQLIAGPIVRYRDVEQQIQSRMVTQAEIAAGIRRFTIGLAKKAVLANSFAVNADKIFAMNPWQNTPDIAWLGAVSYLLQLYFDFSGYSDMAIGLGHMLGFRFLENFNYPFISKSAGEYWRRWHMSLGTWFHQYVYFPLGGSRCSTAKIYRNIIVVWFLTGLWHGADWTYVVWGMLYCLAIVLERSTGFHKKLGPFAHVYVMLLAVLLHVIFRSPDLGYALSYLRSMFGLIRCQNVGFRIGWYLDRYTVFLLVLGAVACTPALRRLWEKLAGHMSEGVRTAAANGITLLLFGICVLYVMTSTYNPFIYFQF